MNAVCITFVLCENWHDCLAMHDKKTVVNNLDKNKDGVTLMVCKKQLDLLRKDESEL